MHLQKPFHVYKLQKVWAMNKGYKVWNEVPQHHNEQKNKK